MTTTITVCGLSTDAEGEDVANLRNITLEFEHKTTTLRELIARTVAAQVQQINLVPGLTTGEKQALLRQRYMATSDRDKPTANDTILNKIDYPVPQALQVDDEIEKAWYGFERQRYMVIINGCQILALDDLVLLSNHAEIIFLRLIPLAGG
jgi:hypothetical protein